MAATIACGVAVIIALAACAPPASTTPDVAVLKTNITGEAATNWNPRTSGSLNLSNEVHQAVYESFVRLDPATYEWDPQLAEEYEISTDRMSMRIKLREDVDFTDGTHLDAEAAVKSFTYALEGGYQSFRDQHSPVFEVIGEYELLLTSANAMGPLFMTIFGIIPLASPTAIENDPAGLESSPVGTGPYVLEDEVPGASLTFERNPNFRDPEAFPFDEVEFLVFDDPVAVVNALKSGQLNAVQLELPYVTEVENSGFSLHAGVGFNNVLLYRDAGGDVVPELAEVRVRQAIAYAIDRSAIAANIEYGFGVDTTQAWGAGSSFYIDGADDTYSYDMDEARALMAEAGVGGFEVTIPTFGTTGFGTGRYEPAVQQALADLGITVIYEPFADWASYAEASYSGDYALSIWTTSDLFLINEWELIQNGGFEVINALLEIRDSGTIEEALEAEHEIGQIVLDEAYAIALSRPEAFWATIPEITVDTAILAWPVLLEGIQIAD
jgi:peptide/nickel transport system substrate-binding protein